MKAQSRHVLLGSAGLFGSTRLFLAFMGSAFMGMSLTATDLRAEIIFARPTAGAVAGPVEPQPAPPAPSSQATSPQAPSSQATSPQAAPPSPPPAPAPAVAARQPEPAATTPTTRRSPRRASRAPARSSPCDATAMATDTRSFARLLVTAPEPACAEQPAYHRDPEPAPRQTDNRPYSYDDRRGGQARSRYTPPETEGTPMPQSLYGLFDPAELVGLR